VLFGVSHWPQLLRLLGRRPYQSPAPANGEAQVVTNPFQAVGGGSWSGRSSCRWHHCRGCARGSHPWESLVGLRGTGGAIGAAPCGHTLLSGCPASRPAARACSATTRRQAHAVRRSTASGAAASPSIPPAPPGIWRMAPPRAAASRSARAPAGRPESNTCPRCSPSSASAPGSSGTTWRWRNRTADRLGPSRGTASSD